MIIDWFSPLPPAHSDIANFTARVLPALARRGTVRLWTDRPVDPALADMAEIVVYGPGSIDAKRLGASDAVVFNMGNDARFHGAIRKVMEAVPGILISHEASYHQSIQWEYAGRDGDRLGYLALVRGLYGDDALLECASSMQDDNAQIYEVSQKYPFLGFIARNAMAVIVHSRLACDAFRRDGTNAVYLPLPYSAGAIAVPRSNGAVRNASRAELRFVQFGFIGPSRRLDQILAALARLATMHPFQLRILGELWDEQEVRWLIARHGLTEQVRIEGFVDEYALDCAIADADLVFNLRNPTMGETSGSQLRIWSQGRPSVVSRVGWYAEFPEDCAIKLAPGHEADCLDRVFDRLCKDRDAYAEVGRRGREYLEAVHRPEAYVDGLLEILADRRTLARDWSARALHRRAAWARASLWRPDTDMDLFTNSRRCIEDLAGALD